MSLCETGTATFTGLMIDDVASTSIATGASALGTTMGGGRLGAATGLP
jgi:hypothetical protein